MFLINVSDGYIFQKHARQSFRKWANYLVSFLIENYTIITAIKIVWFVLNAAWGSSLCYNFGFFQKPSKLWDEWPHDLITWEAKLYYIFQVSDLKKFKNLFNFKISFWVHQYPELYLQRVKTEEIANRVTYSTVYLILTILPYR